jgi:hypothetical protein
MGRGPFVSEFVGGYGDFKNGGQSAVEFAVNDALTLHPNYINVLGWVGGDALAFIKEQPALFNRALRTMGYRLVPTSIEYVPKLRVGADATIKMTWVNRGVGRVVDRQTPQFMLIDKQGGITSMPVRDAFPSQDWIGERSYTWDPSLSFDHLKAGEYTLCFTLIDERTQRHVKLPIKGDRGDGVYPIGTVTLEP